MTQRRDNSGLRKVCTCARRTWAKCDHPWHFNFKPRQAQPPAEWLAVLGRDGQPRDPRKWPGYRLSLDAHFGRKIRSKTEAEALADKLRASMRAGTFYAAAVEAVPEDTAAAQRDGLTVGQLLDAYTQHVLDLRPSDTRMREVYQQNTVRRQMLRLPNGEERRLERWRVSDLSVGSLEQLRAALLVVTRVRHGHRTTVTGGPVAANRGLRCLRTVFNWAIRLGYVGASPFKRGTVTMVKLPREAGRTRRLREGEADRLLAACGSHVRAVVEAALETGMRRGELLTLQWSEVELGKREICLTPAKTKTRTGRTIPISARLAAILELRRLDPAGQPHMAGAYVFGDATGGRVGSVKTAWTAACRRAGIEGLHFHDLRREAGSRWLEGGVPLHQVRDWLGHTTVAQTSTYLAGTLNSGHAAMQRFDAWRETLQRIATGGETGGQSGPHPGSTSNSFPLETSLERVRH